MSAQGTSGSRTYVVTGAGSGIGEATAGILRDRGHRVVGIDLRKAEISADLGTREGRETAVGAALESTGGAIDAVITCAGISRGVAATAAVNFYGTTEVLAGLRPALARSAAPRAVAVSSIASVQPNHAPLVEALLRDGEARALEVAGELAADPLLGTLVYPSSKRALSLWIRAAAVSAEWAGAGIPLNAVAPGTVETPMTADLLASPEMAEIVDKAVPMPLGGHQDAESVANLLVWLASAENSHCAGQTFYCDGGAEVTLRGQDAFAWADERVGEYFAHLF